MCKITNWLQNISTAYTFGQIAWSLVPWIGGGLIAIWSWFADEPVITIVVYSLVVLAVLVYLRNGLYLWKKQRQVARERHLPSDVIQPASREDTKLPTTSPNTNAKDLEILLGTWKAIIIDDNGGRISDSWTFSSNNKVFNDKGEIAGKWTMKPAEILIVWTSFQSPPNNNEPCWETFTRPLDPHGVSGKSWRPDARVLANKLHQVTPMIRAAQVADAGHPEFFIGRWKLGANGNSSDTFLAELRRDMSAVRIGNKTILAANGKWTYQDGEARVQWEDGWIDILRVVKEARCINGFENTASAVKIGSDTA